MRSRINITVRWGSRCRSPKASPTSGRDEGEASRLSLLGLRGLSAGSPLHLFEMPARPRIIETTFGILKSVFRLRQFLLSRLEKVRIEWRWAATAFNMIKLVRHVARLRADFARALATTEDEKNRRSCAPLARATNGEARAVRVPAGSPLTSLLKTEKHHNRRALR